MSEPIRLDLGCGNAKRPGFVGLDMFPGEQVDHVLDLTADPFPFADDTVDEVFSAHFLEHIEEPNHVFSEIGRVCRDGARIEFWTRTRGPTRRSSTATFTASPRRCGRISGCRTATSTPRCCAGTGCSCGSSS